MRKAQTISAREYRELHAKKAKRSRGSALVEYVTPSTVVGTGRRLFVELVIPIRIQSEQNLHEAHWGSRASRAKGHNQGVFYSVFSTTKSRDAFAALAQAEHVTVSFTRLAPATIDSDAAVAGCKFIRDAIAQLLGKDDADPRIAWLPTEQEKSKAYGVRIRIEGQP